MESVSCMGKETLSMLVKPAVLETCADLMATMVPIWFAIAVGLVVGWSWRPRWVSFAVLALRTRPRLLWSTPPGFGARRVWLAMTAITAYPVLKEAWSKFQSWMWPSSFAQGESNEQMKSSFAAADSDISIITNEDLVDLLKRLDSKDGGAPWATMMERSTDMLTYQAWRREPLDGIGPTEYRSRTVLEGIPAELMKDFFWDDEFRHEWDDMLLSHKTWEECPRTGVMVVQWIRKFPFFCKDREYVIGRRIWNAGNEYYCITKDVPCLEVTRQTSPRRVDSFYSSWRIRPVESRRGSEVACEVALFHREDMGIPRELAKLGIRQGMWGCVKKMEPGVLKYQAVRKQGHTLSRSAKFAKICTAVPPNLLKDLGLLHISEVGTIDEIVEKPRKGNLRWLILGGAVALACGVDRGAVGKVLVFGIARRLGRLNRRL